jgi:hypothetical protein
MTTIRLFLMLHIHHPGQNRGSPQNPTSGNIYNFHKNICASYQHMMEYNPPWDLVFG